MSAGPEGDGDLAPLSAIRRFDVFAEYTRQERIAKGYPEDEAKGYGIWLAKVVASRRSGKKAESSNTTSSSQKGKTEAEPKFRSVGDDLPTDETFDHDIIDRTGDHFYVNVFVPAIGEAIRQG